jgi:hypothetical protein
LIYCDKLPDNMYFVCLEIDDVNVVDAGKYKVTAKNNLGESNASITLNFDSKHFDKKKCERISCVLSKREKL